LPGITHLLIRLPLAFGVLLAVASPQAQAKPDFSGDWILNRQASMLSPAAEATQSGTVRIEHRDPTFRYQATLVSATGQVKYEYELPTDGREVAGSQAGTTTASNLRWDGQALVLTSKISRAAGDINISFRYELVDAGRRLRGLEQLRGGGRDQDNIWIFDRR
jgi:hypothetical protein